MITSFRDKGSEDIFNGDNTKEARNTLPRQLWRLAGRKLDMLDAALSVDDLKVPPGNCLEKLKGDLNGKYSIRINDQYRIIFAFNRDAAEVEILDYH